MKKILVIICLLLCVGYAFGGIVLIDDITPKNAAFNVLLDFTYLGDTGSDAAVVWGEGLALSTATLSVDTAEMVGNVAWGDGSTDASITWTWALSGADDPVFTIANDLITLDDSFTVQGTITGDVTGNLTGNASGSSGSCTGLSATATALATTRAIGGVNFDGTAAITPTTIVVADTTDTAAYIGIWEDPTGNLLPKTDAGITYNAGTGVLTATGFAGPLTGNVTGNASGSSGSCTGESATVATITGLAPDTATTAAAQAAITSVGTLTSLACGAITSTGSLIIADANYIGSATDTDAIQIEADGDVVLTQDLSLAVTKSIILSNFELWDVGHTAYIRNFNHGANILIGAETEGGFLRQLYFDPDVLSFGPYAYDGTFDLGNATYGWKDIYAGGTITGGTLTDGTMSIVGGALSGVGTIGCGAITSTGTLQGTVLTLTGDTSVISSAHEIDFKMNGDVDDYIRFSTVGDVPQIGTDDDADLMQLAIDSLTVNGGVYAGKFGGVGDADTYITFAADRFYFVTGNVQMMDFTEGILDKVTVNPTGVDVNFIVESSGNANLFFTDGGNDRVGIGTATPAVTLDVAGDVNGVYISTGANELIAHDVIRHTIITADDTNDVFTEAWNKAVMTKIVHLRAIVYSDNDALVLTADDDTTGNAWVLEVTYDGTDIAVYDQANWNVDDVVTIYIVYEK